MDAELIIILLVSAPTVVWWGRSMQQYWNGDTRKITIGGMSPGMTRSKADHFERLAKDSERATRRRYAAQKETH